ncbi:hypothetical protein BDV96DRAFT_655491 [Lophiotrema nucula]|uniref:Uncharacterized protein n=1 Tax=Lophiotrema nucula TaxID=690887 RepID=A0A6A5YER8_9PLEO|nr:hypothetical protein BDV96DRAFT_655491 [Lophiotrema nucula]
MAHSPLLHDEPLRQHSDHDRIPPDGLEKPQHNPHDRQRPTFFAGRLENWWLGELVAVLSSCALVVALCIILKKYDGQQVPSFGTWFNSGITLGTLVSLLTTLSVAMALSTVQECLSQLKWLWYSGASRPLGDVETYDRASRGLTGSVQLLWKLRFTPTASFGALLTIAHLAIAPLAQQSLLSLSVPVVELDGKATIPSTKDWGENRQQTQILGMPADYASISPGMKGAIFNGVFASANVTINDTLPICTTGNCTFPDYQSLALCASVADVTPRLQNSTGKGESRWCLPGGFCASNNLTTNSATYVVANISSAVTQADKNAAEDAVQSGSLNYTSLAFADHVTPVGDFYIIYTNMTENAWAAVEFVLDWCVPTFSTQVTNGTAVTSRRPDPFMNFDAEPGYTITGHVGGEEVTVDPSTHYTLQRYLNLSLSGLAYVAEVDNYADSDQVEKLVTFFGIGGQGTNVSATRADGLAALDAMLANTATSMTNYMRSRLQVDYVNGTAFAQQNVVHVSWAWIAAPIVFSAASLIFFVTVVALCSLHRSVKPPLWKSSAIATLRCLDPRLHHGLGGAPGRMASNGAADKQSIHLVRDGEGWMLVQGTSTKATSFEEAGIALTGYK